MATEQPKTSQPIHEHPFPQIASYPPPHPQPQHVPGGAYPPPGAYPQYFPYAHPTEANANGDANNPNGPLPSPQFVMPFPPPHGVVYAIPHPAPGQAYAPYPQNIPAAPQPLRPKRKQVKMACTNCAAACKRCDEHRPCERCTKFGLTDTCVDGQRKERKKGIKRGPYKRKNKPNSNEFPANYQQAPEGEWQQQNSAPQGHPSAVTTTAAIHAVAQFSPEGYPYYYPHPPGFIQPMHEGQSADGAPNVNGQPQTMVPYYIHPGAYQPYPYYPHPGAGAAPGPYAHQGVPAQPAPGMESAKKDEGGDRPAGADTVADGGGAGLSGTGAVPKKKTRAGKSGEGKAKKSKSGTTRGQKVSKENGGEADSRQVDELAG